MSGRLILTFPNPRNPLIHVTVFQMHQECLFTRSVRCSRYFRQRTTSCEGGGSAIAGDDALSRETFLRYSVGAWTWRPETLSLFPLPGAGLAICMCMASPYQGADIKLCSAEEAAVLRIRAKSLSQYS